jgi:hypothetical protein
MSYNIIKVERDIYDTIQEIENLGADERLTNAQIKMQEARALISDYVDEQLNSGVYVRD